MNKRPLLVSITEAAELLAVGATTIRRLITQGQLESVKIRRRRLIKMSSLIALSGAGTDLAVHKAALGFTR
jgi:excisionase family DNA binding protein